MNNQRRKQIENLIAEINRVQLEESKIKLADLKDSLEMLKDEEQEYLDNIPENLQQSDKYYNSESAIQTLEENIALMESVIDSIEEFQNNFDLEPAINN